MKWKLNFFLWNNSVPYFSSFLEYSRTPLFRNRSIRSRRHFEIKPNPPWIYRYFFSRLLLAISNSVISNSPLFQTDPFSLWPKIDPVISNSMSTFMDKRQNTPQHSWKISNFNWIRADLLVDDVILLDNLQCPIFCIFTTNCENLEVCLTMPTCCCGSALIQINNAYTNSVVF